MKRPPIIKGRGSGGGGGAPTDAHYLTARAESGLSAEQSLGALTTGLLKNTVVGGEATLSTAGAADLPSAIDAAKIANGSVSNTEFQFLDGVTAGIQGQIDAKGPLLSTVTGKDTGGNLAVADNGKIITVNSASPQVLNLPSLQSEDIGTKFIIVKLGAGRVTIQANTGQYIADSAGTGTIFNKQTLQTYAAITLVAVSTTVWIVTGIFGTWETS